MKKCAYTAHAETHLPPGQPTRAPLTWKSARIAIRSLPASRSWWTPPDAWSASAGNMRSRTQPRVQRPRSNKAASLIEASAVAEAFCWINHKGHEGTRRLSESDLRNLGGHGSPHIPSCSFVTFVVKILL